MESVSVFSLLLLICSLSGAELQDNEIIEQRKVSPDSLNVSDQPQPCPSDIHSALRDMSAALAELRVRMEYLQTHNQEQAEKLRQLEKQTSEVEPMKQQLQEQVSKLTEVDTLKEKQQVQTNEVARLKLHQEAQGSDLNSLRTKTNITENQVEALRRDQAAKQVAFSASLLASGGGNVGPFNTEIPLVFRYIFSNIGKAYNPNTGIFTAPARGVYHFQYYINSWGDSSYESIVALVKNEEYIILAQERSQRGHSSAANGATLLLEAGDVVFLRLRQNMRIYDNERHLTTFSGFLLFPM